MRKNLALVPIALLLVSGCAAQPTAEPTPSATPTPTEPETFIASGTLTVPIDLDALYTQEFDITEGQICDAGPGFEDIAEGTQVVFEDESGNLVAKGELRLGRLVGGNGTTKVVDALCEFPFKVSEIPSEVNLFRVSIGNDVRGDFAATKAEIEEGLELSLGN